MSKNIVLFSDGTGNSSSKLFKTNVWRTYQAVDVADPTNPTDPRQFAFYDDGVGTSSFKPYAVLGGALGAGLARNVRDIYAFICRNYQPGDRIYAFGFSRGAFTIRVLIALILHQGLVRYEGNESELDRLVNAAFRAYRAERYKRRFTLVSPIRWLRDLVVAAADKLGNRPAYRPEMNVGREHSAQPIEIEFLGLWDTVDAYGLPVDELTRAVDKFIWPLTMPDLDLSKRVKRACHALALDDERNTFHPRLWNEATEPGANVNTRHIDQERISQVWFAGVHSDVGGGYPDDSLAHVSLVWIMNEAARCRLRFTPRMCAQYRHLADENGPIHDSRKGIAGYYRYNPRRIDRLSHQRLPNNKVVEIPRTKVHESVIRRIRTGHEGYAPFVLPPGFAVLKFDGRIENGVTGDGDNASAASIATAFEQQHEHVWNWVWWRRVAYFLTLAATLLLALMPLGWPGNGACNSRWCFVSYGINLVTPVLPGFTSTWTDSFSSHPGVFLIIALLTSVGLWSGGVLARRARDAMRPLWHSLPSIGTDGGARFAMPGPPGRLAMMIERLRMRDGYQAFFHALTHELMPVVFLLAVAYGLLALVGQSWFAVRESVGSVCIGSASPRPLQPGLPPAQWNTDALCHATGVVLQKGATYRLHVRVTEPWSDASVVAGPNGVLPADVTFAMTFGVPLRRHLSQPWFKPMARIGNLGTDVYALDPKPSVAQPSERATPVAKGPAGAVFDFELLARSEGELFLYVNDAVLQLPFYSGWDRFFYDNNKGMSEVRIEMLEARP